jgi:hypothetical protein
VTGELFDSLHDGKLIFNLKLLPGDASRRQIFPHVFYDGEEESSPPEWCTTVSTIDGRCKCDHATVVMP